MKNKSFAVIAVLLVIIIGGAAVLYKNLAPGIENNNLMTESTSQEQNGQNTVNSDNTDNSTENSTESEVQYTKAADFVVYDAEGNEVRLSDYVGKPVIVNFWASWCGPCKMEMPDFEEKFKEYGDEIQFMMINVTDGDRDTVEKAKSFIEEAGYTFPVFYDTELNASSAYYVYSLPTSYFIDADGNGIAQAKSAISADTIQKGIDMIYKPENK